MIIIPTIEDHGSFFERFCRPEKQTGSHKNVLLCKKKKKAEKDGRMAIHLKDSISFGMS